MRHFPRQAGGWRVAAAWLIAAAAPVFAAAPLAFKARCVDDLVAEVPRILASQNRQNGQFGKGIWIVTDQDVLWPLAVAWDMEGARNPYHHRADALEAIVRGGDALIADQDSKGQWVFRKKDGSTWGKIYMPWTYSRWIRAYQIIRPAVAPAVRDRWDRALQLGFTGIAQELAATKTLANIPTHHAMALYFASQVFERADWAKAARAFMHRVIAEQHSDGYWSEHSGPVIGYGSVYVEAVGIYAAASHDPAMLEPLRRSALFHGHFTYPDGTDVETVDERNPYTGVVRRGNVGFTLTPEGRTYAAQQLRLDKHPLSADVAATLLRFGEEGTSAGNNDTTHDFDFRLPSGDAAVRRRGPWFIVVSAFTAPLAERRWIQDRQNFVSIYHERAGLILGGGNTKLQPRWSNFTAGDIQQFRHRAGDTAPKFAPPAGVVHIPTRARLIERPDELGVELDYAGRRAEIRVRVTDAGALDYVISGDAALAAHVTLLPHLTAPLRRAGENYSLQQPITWTAVDLPQVIDHGQARVTLPPGVGLEWPVLPHNPYRKDGAAQPAEGRIVLSSPLDGQPRSFHVEIIP
jgi:hypothetical protein